RTFYNEPYQAMPMHHSFELENGTLKSGTPVEYAWRYQGKWNSLRAAQMGAAQLVSEGSEEEFITEHYWGYTAQRNGSTKAYRVDHPSWKIWQTKNAQLDCDIASLYGKQFVAPLTTAPQSAFIAEGSPVTVSSGTVL
ncbi:MAG: hypothetical protein JWO95_1646, partial [Verrucomicrobiales bacterium]|nr:hypothetical protein [Verrucomicrobiales bacterium]